MKYITATKNTSFMHEHYRMHGCLWGQNKSRIQFIKKGQHSIAYIADYTVYKKHRGMHVCSKGAYSDSKFIERD